MPCTEIYTLSLHDALPILHGADLWVDFARVGCGGDCGADICGAGEGPHGVVQRGAAGDCGDAPGGDGADRKSTRLNSSHLGISYAVFCLKKKKNVTATSSH